MKWRAWTEIYAQAEVEEGKVVFMIIIRRRRLECIDLRSSLAATVGDLQARLDFACRVHEAPLVFPFFAGGVILDLPGLVKGFEPETGLDKEKFHHNAV